MSTPNPPLPKFRGDVPNYAAPDRVAWQEKQGKGEAAPWQLPADRVRPVLGLRVQGLIERDRTALTFDAAIESLERISTVCETVKIEAGLPEKCSVHFDTATDAFWVYPTNF